jgi:hypothetical protein
VSDGGPILTVPFGRGDFIDEFLRKRNESLVSVAQINRIRGLEAYHDIFVGSTLWLDDVALKVLAHCGLLLELYRLADQFEHYLSIKRVIQILWIDQRRVLGVCGAEGDRASGLRVHKDGERRRIGAFFGDGIAAGRHEEGAIGDFVMWNRRLRDARVLRSRALNSASSSRWGSLRKAPKIDALWWARGLVLDTSYS